MLTALLVLIALVLLVAWDVMVDGESLETETSLL
jgi:hypothetical protein